MRLSIPQYATALLELEKGMSEGEAKVMGENFFAWLSRRGEGKKIGAILKEAERIVKAESGITPIVITTAEEASEEEQGALRAQAETIFVGDSVEVRFKVDENQIGGVKMRSETFLYDATLSTAVRKLRTSLTR